MFDEAGCILRMNPYFMIVRTLILTLLVITGLSSVRGATFYSIANGTWNNPAIWSNTYGGPTCNATPIGSDYVIISHTVTMDKSLKNGGAGFIGGVSNTVYVSTSGHLNGGTKYSLDVLSQGSLTVCGKLTVLNIEFFNGSVFNFCAGSTVQINGSFINRNNSPNIQINGTVTVVGTFLNGNETSILNKGHSYYTTPTESIDLDPKFFNGIKVLAFKNKEIFFEIDVPVKKDLYLKDLCRKFIYDDADCLNIIDNFFTQKIDFYYFFIIKKFLLFISCL